MQDSIGVVSSRFSDGYDVVGCVLDFYKVSFCDHHSQSNSTIDYIRGRRKMKSCVGVS